MSLSIGVDIGTTTVVAVLFDTDERRVIASHDVPNDTALDAPPGRKEWNADGMVERALSCLAFVRNQAPDNVDTIGVTGQMHGMLLVDGHGRPASPFINWQDQRCEEKDADGPSAIETMVQRAGADAFAHTGCAPATGYMASTLFWLAQQGRDLNDLHACFIPDYLVARMTGCGAVTDPTNAGSAGVLDVTSRTWATPLLDALGLSANILPTVRPSGSLAGLYEGIPVCVACGDNQASVVGTLAEPEGAVFVNIGTGSQVSTCVTEPILISGIDTRCHVDGSWLLVGAPLCGGTSYALLGSLFAQMPDALAPNDILNSLTQLAAEVPPDADGLHCDPTFAGTRAEPGRRGAITGITPDNLTPGHLARAVLEGVAEQLRTHYDRMRDAGAPPCDRIVGSGNAIRKNPLMPEILSNAFGLPVVPSEQTEEAAVGAAILAAASHGRRTFRQ